MSERKNKIQSSSKNSANIWSLDDQHEENKYHEEVAEIEESKKIKDRFWLKSIPFFFVILVLFVVTGVGHGLYNSTWYSDASQDVALAIGFPVGIINTHVVTYSEYQNEYLALQQYLNAPSELQDVVSAGRTIEEVALTKVFRDELLRDLYKEYNITVSETEIEQEFSSIFGTSSTSNTAIQLVQETLGTTPDMLMNGVLSDYVYKRKLSDTLYANEDLLSRQKNIINEVHAEVVANPNLFDQYIDGVTLKKGVVSQYAGLVSPSQLIGSFSEISILGENEISNVIDDGNKFSIFRVARIINEEGVTTFLELEELYILKIGADEMLAQKIADARIFALSPYFYWNESCQHVIENGFSCELRPQLFVPDNWQEPLGN